MNIVSLQFSPIFRPKLGEDKKEKRSSFQFSSIFLGVGQKQRYSPTMCVLKASAQLTKGGGMPQFCILIYANYTILATIRPWLRSRGFHVQAYSDDLAVLVTGADMLWIRGLAQKAINIAANWASEQEQQLSSKKTEILLFTRKRNPDLVSLSMNGSKLKLSKEARLLGVTGAIRCY